MKEKIINFRYVFYPFLAFFLGITMSRKFFTGNLETILMVAGVFVAVGVLFIIKKTYKPLIFLFAFFLVGNGFYFIGEGAYNVKDYTSQVAVVGRVTDDIKDGNYYKQIVLDDVKIDGKSQENLRLTLKNCPNSLNVGDFIAFEGYVERSKPFTLNQFNSQDFRSSVRYQAEISYKDVVVFDGYLKFDERVRLAVKEKLFLHMSEQNAGISYAVLFGDKSEVDGIIKNAYQNSGIIHVLTVSGLHVGFLISLVHFLLKKCKVNKYVQFAITTIFIFFYSYLCGFSPSVLRAGIMAIVLMLSKLCMRRYDNLNSLGFAGFVICLFSPLTAFDIGFQMSFFCVCGIFMLSPVLTKVLSKIIPYKISSLLALSISSQIGILPFLASFGAEINVLSVFANLIVVPAFAIIYPFLFLVSCLSTFLGFLGHLLVVVDYLFVAINAVAIFFGDGFLAISLNSFKRAIIMIYFILIFTMGRFVMIKPLTKLSVFSVICLILTITLGFYLIPKPPENSIVCIGNKLGASVIIENKNRQKFAIGDSYWLMRYLSAFDVGGVDAFLSFDYLGEKDMENLAQLGVGNFIGSKESEGNENIVILENENAYNFGGYTIKIIEDGENVLGTSIENNGQNIFVGCGQTDLNVLKSRGIDADFIFAESVVDDFESVQTITRFSCDADFSLAKNGNMSFCYNNGQWNMRGID